MSIHHDGRIDDTLPIFLIPNPQELEQARETDGLIDRFKLMASNILKRIERTVTEDAQAQGQIQKYIMEMYTNRCDYCNLERSNWSRVNLIGADLIGANLTRADFSEATWCDGCICAQNSIGTCVGCPSVEEVCTGSPF